MAVVTLKDLAEIEALSPKLACILCELAYPEDAGVKIIPLAERNTLPKRPGVYIALDAENQVWYVGRARSLHKRWTQSHHRLAALQRVEGVRLAWLEIPQGCLAYVERLLIDALGPRLNGTWDYTLHRPMTERDGAWFFGMLDLLRPGLRPPAAPYRGSARDERLNGLQGPAGDDLQGGER